MQQEYPCLDILTNCVLNFSEIRSHETSPHAWLNEIALALSHDIGQDIGMALIRVIRGPAESPWSRSFHAVQCGGPERSDKFRSRYTSSVIASGLSPDNFMKMNRSGFECLMPVELHHHAKIARLATLMAERYGVHHFAHCQRSIPASDGVEEGALVLDLWQDSPASTMQTIPPKPILRNIMRALTLHLVHIERQHQMPTGGTILSRLTPSQKHVAELLLQGKSEKQVAACLERSPHTVHQHVKAIYARLSVSSRSEFMVRCIPGTTVLSQDELAV